MTRCELCAGHDLVTVLELGSSPPTCNMGEAVVRRRPETHYPLTLLRCQTCGHVALSEQVASTRLFPDDYPYASGNSRELHEDFADLARQIDPAPDDLLIDIGANDGTLLSKFDCRKIGVEPTAQVEKVGEGIIYRAPFTEELARRLVEHHGHADYVTACNVLAHVPDIHDAMRGIAILLGDHGALWAECGDLEAMVAGGQWDAVYHEHLRFFDIHTFERLCADHGLGIVPPQRIPTHGGSFRVQAKRTDGRAIPPEPAHDFAALQDAARQTRVSLRRVDRPLAGIGATARATTVINYCGLDVEDVPYVAEVTGSDEIGRLIPGTRIPVIDEAELLASDLDAILFSWHLAETIVPALRRRGYEGRIYTPIPHFSEVDDGSL